MTKDKELQDGLGSVYSYVENVEFWVGLLAPAYHEKETIISEIMIKILIANYTFNQALVHPLLSENAWRNSKETFLKAGFEIVKESHKIKDIY